MQARVQEHFFTRNEPIWWVKSHFWELHYVFMGFRFIDQRFIRGKQKLGVCPLRCCMESQPGFVPFFHRESQHFPLGIARKTQPTYRVCFWVDKDSVTTTLPETEVETSYNCSATSSLTWIIAILTFLGVTNYMAPKKWMVGKLLSFWDSAYFQEQGYDEKVVDLRHLFASHFVTVKKHVRYIP